MSCMSHCYTREWCSKRLLKVVCNSYTLHLQQVAFLSSSRLSSKLNWQKRRGSHRHPFGDWNPSHISRILVFSPVRHSLCPRPLLTHFSLKGHFRIPLGLCIETRLSAQPLLWKWIFMLLQIIFILTTKVVHQASFWKWGSLELGNDLSRDFHSLLTSLSSIFRIYGTHRV